MAQKVYWSVIRDDQETVVATDRFNYRLVAGRVVSRTRAVLRFKAVYENETKIKDVAVTIKEDIAEPEFTVQAQADWDGRKTTEVVPRITNTDAPNPRGWVSGDEHDGDADVSGPALGCGPAHTRGADGAGCHRLRAGGAANILPFTFSENLAGDELGT